jgi:hypothetical protein
VTGIGVPGTGLTGTGVPGTGATGIGVPGTGATGTGGRDAGGREAGPVTVTLPIPARGWYQLGLEESGRPALIAGQYDELVAARPLLDTAQARAAFTESLTVLAEHYAARGCQIAAVAWQPESGGPPQAVIQVSVTPWQAGGGDPIATLTEQLGANREGDIGPRSVETVDLPPGPAVRARVIADGGEDHAGRQVVSDVVQYWLPLPLPERGLAVVAASSTAILDEGTETASMFDVLVERLTVS